MTELEEMLRRWRRWWWIIGVAVLASAAAVSLFAGVRSQTQYEAVGSYLVRADVDDPGDQVRATATLVDNDQVIGSIAAVARSERIENRVRVALRLEDDDVAEVIARPVAGSNVLELGARSGDPDLAAAAAAEFVVQASRHVRFQTQIYRLEAIDVPAAAQRLDAGADWATVFGAGGFGGVLAAALIAWGASPTRRRVGPVVGQVQDPLSGAVTLGYLRHMVEEERLRHEAGAPAFSLGVLRVERMSATTDLVEPAILGRNALGAVRRAIEDASRPYDVVARVDHGCFAALFPMTDLDEARRFVVGWKRRVSELLAGADRTADLRVMVAAATWDAAAFIGDREAEMLADRL